MQKKSLSTSFISNIYQELEERQHEIAPWVFRTIAFFVVFYTIGTLIPWLSIKIRNPESFYHVTSMLAVEKTVAPCESMTFAQTRYSSTFLHGTMTRALTKINPLGEPIVYSREINLSPDENGTSMLSLRIPCGIEEGLYVYDTRVEFTVEGVEKEISYHSNTFEVKNNEQ